MSGLPLAGRVALVSGGARRTGRAIAMALAAAGADVVVHHRHSHTEAHNSSVLSLNEVVY